MRELPQWFGLGDGPGDDRVGEPPRTIVVVGCPVEDPDGYRGGAAAGPGAIRRWTRTAEAVDESGRPVEGVRVIDVGDVGPDPATPREVVLGEIREEAGAALERVDGALLLGLGGDHGVTPPLAEAVAADAGGELGLVLLDAHPDAFERYGGRRDAHACVVPRVWELDGFSPGRTALVGLRSYAVSELANVRRAGAAVTARDWARRGPAALVEEIREVTDGSPLYLSLDIDVLDPGAAPGTGYPVPGGPGSRELLELLARLFRRCPVRAMDLVEVAPELDPSGRTAATAAHLCLQCLAHWARSPLLDRSDT